MAASFVPPKRDIVALIEDVEAAGVRFVYFSPRNMRRSKVREVAANGTRTPPGFCFTKPTWLTPREQQKKKCAPRKRPWTNNVAREQGARRPRCGTVLPNGTDGRWLAGSLPAPGWPGLSCGFAEGSTICVMRELVVATLSVNFLKVCSAFDRPKIRDFVHRCLPPSQNLF